MKQRYVWYCKASKYLPADIRYNLMQMGVARTKKQHGALAVRDIHFSIDTDGDDFVKELVTCVVRYALIKIPRILKKLKQ